MPIETPRLLLRRFTLDDADALYWVNSDPDVTKYIPFDQNLTPEKVREALETRILADYERHGFGRLAVISKEDGKLIGFTGLKFMEDMGEVDVGYRLHSDYWGRGLATESARPTVDYGFRELDLERIVGIAMPENVGSVRVLEKLGLRYEKEITVEDIPCSYYALNQDEYLGA